MRLGLKHRISLPEHAADKIDCREVEPQVIGLTHSLPDVVGSSEAGGSSHHGRDRNLLQEWDRRSGSKSIADERPLTIVSSYRFGLNR